MKSLAVEKCSQKCSQLGFEREKVEIFWQNNKENRDEEKRALILREWKTAFTLKHRLLELPLTGKMS